MKLDSKFFDSIRVAPKRLDEREEQPPCQWKGCPGHGLYRAPRGRGREGQYYLFCMQHIRHYNTSYNYFEGMTEPEVEEYQREAVTGHRPTWRMGTGFTARAGVASGFGSSAAGEARQQAADPHGLFTDDADERRERPAERRRAVRPLERKALETLRLTETAGSREIKARFKELVKRHHPDLNGGDSRSEDRLREVIQAYTFLRQAGLA